MLPLLDLPSSSCILPSERQIAAGEVISAAQAAECSAVYNAMDQRHTYFMHLRYIFILVLESSHHLRDAGLHCT